MGDNGFLGGLKEAMQVLSAQLNLPHLKLNDQYICKLKYNNAFDLEIIGMPEGGLQLHAFIMPVHDDAAAGELFRTLLEWNTSEQALGGCYFGLSHLNRAISFNHIMYLEQIDSITLMTILHNFINKAQAKQEKIVQLGLNRSGALDAAKRADMGANSISDNLNLLAHRA